MLYQEHSCKRKASEKSVQHTKLWLHMRLSHISLRSWRETWNQWSLRHWNCLALQHIKLVYIKLPVELPVVQKAREQVLKLVSPMIFTPIWWKWNREWRQEKTDRIKSLKTRKHFGCPLCIQSTFCPTCKPKKISRSSSPHILFSGCIHVKRSKLRLVGSSKEPWDYRHS